MVKASFVQRLKCLSLQYSQSASFILPAHDHGGIICGRRIERKERPSKRWTEKRLRKKKEILVRKGNKDSDRPSSTQIQLNQRDYPNLCISGHGRRAKRLEENI